MDISRRARLVERIVLGAGIGAGLVFLGLGVARQAPVDPALPPLPILRESAGTMPAGIVSFEERVSGNLHGCGFFLRLPNGEVVGVTTAHSLPGRSFHPWEFRIAGRDTTLASLRTPFAPLGTPRMPGDLTGDYALAKPDSPPDPSIVLDPDPRGGPEPGERVSLYSGVGSHGGGQRILQGTVEWLDPAGAWIRMDDIFDPQLMSGSPILSQHTGKVVGTTNAMRLTPRTLRIGSNPIRSIVDADPTR